MTYALAPGFVLLQGALELRALTESPAQHARSAYCPHAALHWQPLSEEPGRHAAAISRQRTHEVSRECSDVRSVSTRDSSACRSMSSFAVSPRASGSLRITARRAASSVRTSWTVKLQAHMKVTIARSVLGRCNRCWPNQPVHRVQSLIQYDMQGGVEVMHTRSNIQVGLLQRSLFDVSL